MLAERQLPYQASVADGDLGHALRAMMPCIIWVSKLLSMLVFFHNKLKHISKTALVGHKQYVKALKLVERSSEANADTQRDRMLEAAEQYKESTQLERQRAQDMIARVNDELGMQRCCHALLHIAANTRKQALSSAC